jgi:response regulator of citrate/malate metabolism
MCSAWTLFWLKLFERIPHIRKKIEQERQKMIQQLKMAVAKDEPKQWLTNYDRLPEKGLDSTTLLTIMKKYREYEIAYSQGKAFGGIYGNLFE